LKPAKSDPFSADASLEAASGDSSGSGVQWLGVYFAAGTGSIFLSSSVANGLENGIRSLFKFMQYRDCSAGICAQIAERLKDSH